MSELDSSPFSVSLWLSAQRGQQLETCSPLSGQQCSLQRSSTVSPSFLPLCCEFKAETMMSRLFYQSSHSLPTQGLLGFPLENVIMSTKQTDSPSFLDNRECVYGHCVSSWLKGTLNESYWSDGPSPLCIIKESL